MGHPPPRNGSPDPFPGVPGPPPPPGRPPGSAPRRRWGPILGGTGAALLLLVSTGVVVASLSGGNGPYASLPGCGTLMPRELLQEIPGVGAPRASGQYTDYREAGAGALLRDDDFAFVGALPCEVTDGGEVLMVVDISLSEPRPSDPEAAQRLNEHLVEAMGERREPWENGDAFDSVLGRDVREWRETGVGDGGTVAFMETSDNSRSREAVIFEFVTDNLWVRALHTPEGTPETGETLDRMERFSERLHRHITREAEPAV